MKILLTVAVVICGCSVVLARPFRNWYDDDWEDLFGRYAGDDYGEDYDVNGGIDAELREIFGGETKSRRSNENDNDDKSIEVTSPAVGSSTSDEDYIDNILLRLLGHIPEDDESDPDYNPTTEATSDEEDDDYMTTTADSWSDLVKQEWTDSSEEVDNGDQSKEEEEDAVTVFSAHLDFNTDNQLTVNLLSSDANGHVHYNAYDVISSSQPEDHTTHEPQPIETEASETNEKSVERVEPSHVDSLTEYQRQKVDLLQKMSLSSANSEVLPAQYSENIRDFVAVHRNLRESLDMLQRHNEQLYEEFFEAAGDRSDYNGQQHKKIEREMVGMLTKIDEVKGKIMEMQSVEQKLNYHLLLNALLSEIYKGKDDL